MTISTIIADSINEITQIQNIAQEKGIVAEIGIRINPDFTFTNNTGIPSKFGIDEQLVLTHIAQWKQFKNIRIIGIHTHLRSQELHAAPLFRYYENILSLAATFQNTLGQQLRFINMGSGIGIPHAKEDHPLDIVQLGNNTSQLAESFRRQFPDIQIAIKTGRYLVGKSGLYVTLLRRSPRATLPDRQRGGLQCALRKHHTQ